MWANRMKPTQGVVNLVTNDCDIHNHWIYIQRPACTFNLSSSSSSVARTTWSGLRRLCLARITATRYPTAGQAIPPPLDTSCYSPQTAAPCCNRTSYNPSPPLNLRLHCRVFPSPSRSRPGLAVVHRLAALGAAWSTNESHRKRTVRGEPDGWDPRGPWSHASSSLLS